MLDFRPQQNHGGARRAATADVDEAPESAALIDVEGAPSGKVRLYPLVQFQVAPGVWESQLVLPEEWTVEDGGREVAKRVQVPLKLACAVRSRSHDLRVTAQPCPPRCASLLLISWSSHDRDTRS